MPHNRTALIRGAAACASVALAAAPAIATANTPTAHTAKTTTTVISTGKVKRGTVVVSKSGLTLYGFANDHHSSTCYGRCTKTWIPWIANGKVTVKQGSGLSQSLLGTIKRSNGERQITYGGHPLYHYVGDTAAGQQNGQDKKLNGGRWYVISKAGKFLKPPRLIGAY